MAESKQPLVSSEQQTDSVPSQPAWRSSVVESQIPARMDRLPFCCWHIQLISCLGISWIMDGLQVTNISGVGSTKIKDYLDINDTEVGAIGSVYTAGMVIGSMVLGIASDLYGRRKIFIITPFFYLFGTLGTCFSFSYWQMLPFIFFTGFGVGGEYSSINSAVDEMIPARVRGAVDILINGSYWLGAAFSAGLQLIFLNDQWFETSLGWRLCFGVGTTLGAVILVLRFFMPESPRWLLIHGRSEQAEEVVAQIERRIERFGHQLEPVSKTILINKQTLTYPQAVKYTWKTYPRRCLLCLILLVTQAFLYNSIFLTYGLTLQDFFQVAEDDVQYYLFPFAIGNFLGCVVLGRFFDVIGRRNMIALTYITSSIIMLVCSILFVTNVINSAVVMTGFWSGVFFFASAGASAAYLQLSEIFPQEVRALAIAFFYFWGTLIGGVSGPLIYGWLIDQKERTYIFGGYIFAIILMACGGVVGKIFGVAAEGKSLEDVADPVNKVERKSMQFENLTNSEQSSKSSKNDV